jgi:hypothetical protein
MQTTTWLHDARCKQVYGWHINILCIFLINFYIKYFVFWVTVWKIWFMQDLHISCHFHINRIRAGNFSHRGTLSHTGLLRGSRRWRGGEAEVATGWGWRAGSACQLCRKNRTKRLRLLSPMEFELRICRPRTGNKPAQLCIKSWWQQGRIELEPNQKLAPWALPNWSEVRVSATKKITSFRRRTICREARSDGGNRPAELSNRSCKEQTTIFFEQ